MARFRAVRHLALRFVLPFLSAAGWVLPRRVLVGLGTMAGLAALRLDPRSRQVALDNLRVAFPELSEEDRLDILDKFARHMGAMLGEVLWLRWASANGVRKICAVEGIEVARSILEGGSGFVLVTGHCGNWEVLNACLAVSGLPMTIVVRSLFDKSLNVFSRRLRERFGTRVLERGGSGKALLEALVDGGVVGLLIDQDIRDVPGVFVPFFGRDTWTPIGAGVLAVRAGCPIVPTFTWREGGVHRVCFQDPIYVPEGVDPEDAARLVTAEATLRIERQIRSHPEQWVWMHRRWRTRPPGEV